MYHSDNRYMIQLVWQLQLGSKSSSYILLSLEYHNGTNSCLTIVDTGNSSNNIQSERRQTFGLLQVIAKLYLADTSTVCFINCAIPSQPLQTTLYCGYQQLFSQHRQTVTANIYQYIICFHLVSIYVLYTDVCIEGCLALTLLPY